MQLVLENVKKSYLVPLKKLGFALIKPKSEHEEYRLRGISNLILYKSGKLVISGSEKNIEETKILLKKAGTPLHEVIKKKTRKPRVKVKVTGRAVGTDETLKGDTFGGIVVCGFFADDETREELKTIGVKDSKELNNADITRLAKELIEKYPDYFHVENLKPKEYNNLNKKKNVTKIMDLLHQKCYKKLAGRKKGITHIVDEYPGCGVGKVVAKRAESKYVEVAAASIIARYEAMKQFRQLEMEAGFFIPLGSTHVEDALFELQRKGLKPDKFVKLKFKNVKKAFKLD